MSWGRNSRSGGPGRWPWWVWLFIGWLFINAIGTTGGAAGFIFLTIAILFAVLYGISRLGSTAQQSSQQERRQAQNQRWDQPSYRAVAAEEDLASRRAASPQTVAERALRRAGNLPDSWMLHLEDVGLLSYHGDASPDVVRQSSVHEDASHLRPFIVINLPYKQGRGTIRFELFDETGEKQFESAEIYQLKGGPNFITPRTWLPMEEARSAGRWSLRVSIGDKPLAVHEFQVREAYSGQMRQFLHEDGEIDPWLSRAIVEQDNAGESMSLDELLASAGPDELEAESNRLR